MDSTAVWFRYAFVLVHVFALAVALGAVLREDFRLVVAKAPRIDPDHVRQVAHVILYALGALWVSGLALIAIDTGFDPARLASPKIMAKLIVVITLTANGLVLHHVMLPMLSTPAARRPRAATLFSIVGAVSMVSWLYAACLGVAKPLIPLLGYVGFIGTYCVLLALAVVGALTVMRPRVEQLLETVRPHKRTVHAERYEDFALPLDFHNVSPR